MICSIKRQSKSRLLHATIHNNVQFDSGVILNVPDRSVESMNFEGGDNVHHLSPMHTMTTVYTFYTEKGDLLKILMSAGDSPLNQPLPADCAGSVAN